MFPPFFEEEAHAVCLDIVRELEQGSLVLEQLSTISQERENQGVMIGSLVCKDLKGNVFTLKTNSGISKRLVRIKDFDKHKNEILVEPIVSHEVVQLALNKNDKEIHLLTDKINALKKKRLRSDGKYNNQTDEERILVQKRLELCNESLGSVYDLYSFCCFDGKIVKLNQICKEKLPPTGTGDCCAPKLLNYAFKNSYIPLSLCEVYYEKGLKSEEVKSYPPCDERCSLILPSMLGLNILYRDEDIIVVNKQSGLLSVPGRGPDKQDCIVNRVKKLFPHCIEQPSVHRLDMETSGLLLLAFTKEAHRELNRQFENREVKKEYEALLSSRLSKDIKKHGTMELFFRLDVDNRPHQIWDKEYGKSAVTEWDVLGEEEYTSVSGKKYEATRVLFIPHTGRTHQLRLASADIHGFGVPIIGDSLYGTCEEGERLLLHARYLCFKHPRTGRAMEFYCAATF